MAAVWLPPLNQTLRLADGGFDGGVVFGEVDLKVFKLPAFFFDAVDALLLVDVLEKR